MSKDENNKYKGGFPEGIDEALEVRIVAWLLGEASEFEQAELEAMVRDDEKVRAFHDQMKSLIGEARSAHGMDGPEKDSDWRLSEERRGKVMAELGGATSGRKSTKTDDKDRWPGASSKRRMQWISAVAAMVIFGFGLWALSRMMFGGYSKSVENEVPSIVARMPASDAAMDHREAVDGEALPQRKPSAPAASEKMVAATNSVDVYLPEVESIAELESVGTSADLGMGFGGQGQGAFRGAGVAGVDQDDGEARFAFEQQAGESADISDKKYAFKEEPVLPRVISPESTVAASLPPVEKAPGEVIERERRAVEQKMAKVKSGVESKAVSKQKAQEVTDTSQEAGNGPSVDLFAASGPAADPEPAQLQAMQKTVKESGRSVGEANGIVVSGGVRGNDSLSADESLPLGQNPVTAGNRSGDFGITRGELDAVLNGDVGGSGTGMVTKTYNVPPDFVPADESDSDYSGADPFAVASTGNEVAKKMSAEEYLRSRGVPLSDGSSVDYDPESGKLTVTAGEDAVGLVDVLTDNASVSAPGEDGAETAFPMTPATPTELPNAVDIQLVDRIPVLGDVPANGRLFDSEAHSNNPSDEYYAEMSNTARRELVRRHELKKQSHQMAVEGDEFYKQGETAEALQQYEQALDALPKGESSEELREAYRQRISAASVKEAEKRIAEGRYREAESLLNSVLLPDVDPDNNRARQMLTEMDSEERYPLVASDEDNMAGIERKAQEVTRLLKQGESYLQLDDHEAAERQFDKVLAIDPYNKAAQQYHERIERFKIDYYGLAYNRTRAEMLSEVDALWEIRPPKIPVQNGFESSDYTLGSLNESADGEQSQQAEKKSVDFSKNQQRKIERTIIPGISFENQSLLEVVQFLRAKSREVDSDPNPENRGVSIVIDTSSNIPGSEESSVDYENIQIDSLEMRDATLEEILKVLAEKAGMEVKVEEYAVVLVPKKGSEPKPQKKPKPEIDFDEIFLEKSAADEGVSTFSLHVNDASFKVATALLESGQWPNAERVREEEFVNALDYDDPSPTAAERISAQVEQAAHPFIGGRNLVRIGLKTASVGRDTRMPLHLTILLDTSGSMEREDRREIVARSLASLSAMLGENDVVSLIGFSRNSRLLIDRVPGDRAGELVETAMALPAEGGTNIEAALTLAAEIAQRQFNAEGQNRVVMLTDGAANLGGVEAERLMALGSEFRDKNLALDCYGVGIDGLDDEVLEALTRKGDGRYFVLNAPQEADREFAEAVAGTLSPLALDVKVQVRFNPDRVGGYRLIGFRKQRLNEEDFRNDAVDGGEIAAAAEGNALYQVEVVPDGIGDIGEVWVRFRDARTGEMVEKQWLIPYQPDVEALAEASETMKMAGLAGLFAEALLKGPEIGGEEAGELEPLAKDVAARRHYDERLKTLSEAISDATEF